MPFTWPTSAKVRHRAFSEKQLSVQTAVYRVAFYVVVERLEQFASTVWGIHLCFKATESLFKSLKI